MRILLLTVALGGLGACTDYGQVRWGDGTSWAEAKTRAQGPAALRPRVAPPSPRPTRTAPPFTHVVSGGDNVTTIAARYAVPPERIVEANRLQQPYTLRVGQRIVIPGAKPKPAAVAGSAAPAWTWDWSGAEATAQPGPRSPQPVAASPTPAAPRPSPAPRREVASSDPTPSPAGGGETLAERLGEKLTAFFVSLFAGARGPADGAPAGADVGREVAEPSAEAVRAAASAEPPELSGDGFLWPVEGTVLATFGDRPDGTRNDGINIAAREGTPVLAAENGIVAYAGDAIPGFGRLILIRHAKGYMTAYAHNAALLADVGETVRRGQAIARVGRTGRVDAAQLHFEIRRGEEPVDPMTLLKDDTPEFAGRG